MGWQPTGVLKLRASWAGHPRAEQHRRARLWARALRAGGRRRLRAHGRGLVLRRAQRCASLPSRPLFRHDATRG